MAKMKKSFYEWCIENNHEDWLLLWDYELNGCNPKNVAFSSLIEYYFKCPKGVHNSEKKKLNELTRNKFNKKLKCKQCNSFGQYLIDTYGEDALEEYWDYKTNKVDPFEISKCSNKKVWIKCQDKNYHESYDVICSDFVKGRRCPYCCNHHGKVHPKDSFAQYHIDNTDPNFLEKYWSKLNTVDPFSISPNSTVKVWIICQNDEEHKDYKISCYNFFKGTRCSICNESKGERKIREILKLYNINFIPQKAFPNLVGIGEKSLSYDFYLPEQNLLIEYQGEFHDRTIKGDYKYDFERQQEHDKRKREYAESHSIELLEIWYYDYNNIETILNNVLM